MKYRHYFFICTFALKLIKASHIPDAMTGSFISSLVIGQRNSSGIPEESVFTFVLSSSIFLRTLLRSPRDSVGGGRGGEEILLGWEKHWVTSMQVSSKQILSITTKNLQTYRFTTQNCFLYKIFNLCSTEYHGARINQQLMESLFYITLFWRLENFRLLNTNKLYKIRKGSLLLVTLFKQKIS